MKRISNRLKAFFSSKLVKLIVIVAMAYGFAAIMMAPLQFSIGAIGAGNSDDFKVTDLFHAIANSRDVREVDRDIVIVDIRNYDRDEIAQIVNYVNLCDPKAVGLDVVFAEDHGGDEPLLEALANTPNLVMPVTIGDDGNGAYRQIEQNFFGDSLKNIHFAAANFDTKKEGGTIREYIAGYKLSDGSVMPSFASEIMKIADSPERAEREMKKHPAGVINYPSHEFTVIDGREILDRGEELSDKIVLLGSMSDRNDMHRTPIDSNMPGVLVHAHTLHTMLSGSSLVNCPAYIEMLVAFLVAAFFIWLAITLDVGIKGLVIRLMQFIALYAVIIAGYVLFVDRGVVVDFSQSFLMLTFALFACDIWLGLKTIAKYINQKYITWKSAKYPHPEA